MTRMHPSGNLNMQLDSKSKSSPRVVGGDEFATQIVQLPLEQGWRMQDKAQPEA